MVMTGGRQARPGILKLAKELNVGFYTVQRKAAEMWMTFSPGCGARISRPRYVATFFKLRHYLMPGHA